MRFSLRQKAGFGLLIMAILGIGALVTFHRMVVAEQFDRIERREVERDALRVVNALDVQADALNLLVLDWAFWDDTYEFIAGPGPGYDSYLESNLTDDLVESLGLGALLFIDRSGGAYWEDWLWPSGESEPIQGLEADSPLVTSLALRAQRAQATAGVVRLPNGQLMLAAAAPILTSTGAGPSQGTLIMTRWLDGAFEQALAESLATPLRFESLASEPDVVARTMTADAIAIIEDGELNGQALIRDIDGEPAFLVETSQRRDIGTLSNQVLWLSILTIVVTLGAFGGVVYFGADALVLRPLLRLRRELAELSPSSANGRLSVTGRDETAEVAMAVNEMLDRLVASAAEQERLTIAVSEQEEVARTALLEMGEGFLAFDSSGRCQVSNPAAARMLKRSPDEIRQRHITDLLPTAAAAEPGGGPQVVSVGGRSLAITRSASLSRGRRGGRSVVVLRDVTDILDVERLKRDIIATVSHELRTPLTSIRATVELFQSGDGGGLTEVQGRMLALLSRNTDRLLAIVNDLLALTTLESGGVSLRREECDLAVTVAHVVEDAQPMAAASAIDLEVGEIDEACVAWCDEPRIRLVIDNLVQNAVKFSPSGSKVTVSARPEGDEIAVTVTDEGPGIAPAEQERVFEKFYRTPGSDRVPGTGLGLTISRLIVELHGGRIWIESGDAAGTTVRFTVPAPP